ncbi:DUF4347 domain-containing protein [Acetobacteraceae bacterium H6797]|nr:DUF4347 domain-containing protein [Acetobacteraceae bacterium H6797]
MVPPFHKRQLLVIDPRVRGWQELALGAHPGVSVVMLEPGRDGLAQILEALDEVGPVSAVHLVDEGHRGRLRLGATRLDSITTGSVVERLATIGRRIRPDGAVILWSEALSADSAGFTLLSRLARAIGRDVVTAGELLGDPLAEQDWMAVVNGPLCICPADAVLPGALARFQALHAAPPPRERRVVQAETRYVPFCF